MKERYKMKRDMTRSQKRAARIAQAVRITACLVLCIIVAGMMVTVSAEDQKPAGEYLEEIGADAQTQAELLNLYKEWEK